MKCEIPEIAYHDRDPVLSLHFQPSQPGEPVRLATAGSDTHVVVWAVTRESGGDKVELDCLADLTRHQRAVNIVRWSPDGQLLASGDDESVIIVWKRREEKAHGGGNLFDDGEESAENWGVYKMLRYHLDDVYDLSWSPCSQFLLSGSVDNTAIVSGVHKGRKICHLSDSRGFVQGVAWNGKQPILSTLGSDRSCRSYSTKSMKLLSKTYKCTLELGKEGKKVGLKRKKTSAKKKKAAAADAEAAEEKVAEEDVAVSAEAEAAKPGEDGAAKGKRVDESVRLFHDDTFKGFFRRLSWSPDGELLVVPSGVIETEGESNVSHCTWVFTRLSLAKPALCLPSRDKYTIAVSFNPVWFSLRPAGGRRGGKAAGQGAGPGHKWEEAKSVFALPYRMVYAVATQNAVMFYDTQQVGPFARVSNIHYTGLTDLCWSPCGTFVVVSSSDGFCSIITFDRGELGEELPPSPTAVKEGAATAPATSSPLLQPLSAAATSPVLSATSPTPGLLKATSPSPSLLKATSPSPGLKAPALQSPPAAKAGPKRLQFVTLSSPKAEKKKKKPELPQEEDLAAQESEAPEPMDTESAQLSLVLEESQSEAPERKRAPLTTLANTLPCHKTGTPEKEKRSGSVGRRVSLITLSSPKGKH